MSDDRTRLLEDMFRASPDAVIVVGVDGVIQAASPAVEALFGYLPDELIGQAVEVLIPANLRAAHEVHRKGFVAAPVGRPMGVGLQLRGLHRDGSVFPVDVSLVPVGGESELRVGAFVRDATERRRGEDLLRFVNEISRGVIAGEPAADLLSMTASRARAFAKATTAWISVLSDSGQEMEVAAVHGAGADTLIGATVAVSSSLAAQAMSSGQTVAVAEMSSDPAVMAEARAIGLSGGLYVPMQAEHGPVGTLVLARGVGEVSFDEGEVAAAEVFASAAAIVLALASARQSLDEMRISSEHERIARDLHDTVIQRLFGLGMRLQAAERMADGVVAERIRATVDSIDEVIREIRETIFDLNRPDRDGSALRSVVRGLVVEAGESLGFRPRLAFRGPVEAAVPEALGPQIVAVLREALSNIQRHAHASAADIVLAVVDDRVELSVADDGVGPSDGPGAGHGLANMAARAARLGGSVSVSARRPAGTLVQWSAPLGTP